MSRILLITSTLPWPLRRNGGGQRTALLRRALEKWGQVDVLAIGGQQLMDETVTPAALAEHGITKSILREKHEKPAPWYAAGPLRGMHELLESWRDRFRPDATAQAWLGQQPRYDIIVARYLAAAMQGGVGTEAAGDAPVLLDFDDMEWQTLQAQLAHAPWPGLKGKVGSSMVLREVRRLCFASLPLFNHVWVTSDEDDALLPYDAPTHDVLPNIPYAQGKPLSGESNANEVLFVGDLQLPPNREGLERFLTQAWPKITAAIPATTLRIVGRGLTDDQRARWSKIPGVDVIGFAPNLGECYQRAAVCIVPTFFGGGTKIKVLEALQYERSVVTTEHAMRGYRALNAEAPTVWVAPDITGIADGCITLLKDAALRRDMARRGKATVERHFSFDRFQKVVDIAVTPLIPSAAVQV